MRVLGVLVAWGVLAVLGTMCFALGGSLGYRRGVGDTLAQIRDRRTGKAGCRPLPANHLRRRTSGHARPGARARRARWHTRPAGSPTAGSTRVSRTRRSDPRITVLAASAAAVLLIGVPGTAIGATTARPGESMWTVKLGLERVRVALTRGNDADAEVHLDLASARLSELGGLVHGDIAPKVVDDVSTNLGTHATAATDRLTRVEDRTQRIELAERLTDLVSTHVLVMDTLLERDCADVTNSQCRELDKTREESVALRDTTAAAADPVVLAAEDPSESTALADEDDAVVSAVEVPETGEAGAATEGTAAQEQATEDGGAEGPAAAAAAVPGAAASDTPSPEPSAGPSATPTPGGGAASEPPAPGSPATESVDPGADAPVDAENGTASEATAGQ